MRVPVINRKLLAAAASLAPFLAAGVCQAQSSPTQISTATTTPVRTSTIDNGQPNDLEIVTGGSVSPTAAGVAVTLDSNNSVSNAGSISFKDVDNATGLQIDAGFTGGVTLTGSISVSETYSAPVSTITGIPYGDWASGENRIGVLVTGSGVFNGSITDTGTLTVQGNNSSGIEINAPISGDLMMLTVTPPTVDGGTSTVAAGTISVTGTNVVGLNITPTGGVQGVGGPGNDSIRVTSITARGINAQAVAIDGAVAGTVNVSAGVSATGYFSTTRPTQPNISVQYPATDFYQGGPAINIGANLGGGLILSVPPTPLSTDNLDQDNDGVPDASQGSGSATVYGSAPAIQIGSTTQTVELGEVGTGDNAYGLVIQGSVVANGVYDPLFTPFLPGPVSATALQIGVVGGQAVTLDGGLHNTGAILANAYQADATGIHVLAGGAIPALVNNGAITASSVQVSSATTVTPASGSTPAIPAPVPVTVTGILIDAGANVTSLTNTQTISAALSGSGGVGGSVAGIVDKSGSLASVENSGNIVAGLIQQVANTPMPAVNAPIGVFMSNNAAPQSLIQDLAPGVADAPAYVSTNTYAIGDVVLVGVSVYEAVAAAAAGQSPSADPTLWKLIGTTTPSIVGSLFFGNGGSTLSVAAGTITGTTIELGAGVNTVTIDGVPPTETDGIINPGTVVLGALKDEGNYTLTLNVVSGTLSDTNPGIIHANAINVGAHGTLLVTADPLHGQNTLFQTAGASTFATGAQLGLTLLSVQQALSQTYTVVQAVGAGTITAGTFGGQSLLNNSPYLYTATPSFVPASGATSAEIDLTVARKNQTQLGFDNAEYAALDSILAAVPADADIQAAILQPTTETTLKANYDQLLPPQGQGIFEALDAAAQAVSSMTDTNPDPNTVVGGSSLWLQEVNERVQRSGIETLGSSSQIIGLVGGFERMGVGGGSLGATLSYMNAQETDDAAVVGEHVVSSMVEGSLYYRRTSGPLTLGARAGIGYAWFSSDRQFLATIDNGTASATNTAFSNWGGVFYEAHLSAAYEERFGRFFARPELSVDYLGLHESASSETGGGPGFDLNIESRTSTRFSGQALVALGEQWGKAQWLRAEVRGGYREIFSGNVGDTVASFDGGTPFTLVADPDKGGWVTVGFSIRGGTEYSYLALEGDADFREGEQRYDLRVAGRSMF